MRSPSVSGVNPEEQLYRDADGPASGQQVLGDALGRQGGHRALHDGYAPVSSLSCAGATLTHARANRSWNLNTSQKAKIRFLSQCGRLNGSQILEFVEQYDGITGSV